MGGTVQHRIGLSPSLSPELLADDLEADLPERSDLGALRHEVRHVGLADHERRKALRAERSLEEVLVACRGVAVALVARDTERDIVRMVVDKYDGNQTEASRTLGLSRTTVWRILRE